MPRLGQPSMLGNYTLGEKQEIARVNHLTDRQVRRELKDIMRGQGYSWHTISQKLKEKMLLNLLKVEHFEPENILYEWNILCDEKISWELTGRPSFKSFKFNRDCLLKLKLIPTQAGLGSDGRKFATTNVDMRTAVKTCGLAVARLEVVRDWNWRFQEFGMTLEESRVPYFYPEGPEFRIEYIHDRVEE